MARLLLLEEYLELGDMAQFDEEFETTSKLDRILHQPVISGFLARFRVERSIVGGRFEEAESTAAEEMRRSLGAISAGGAATIAVPPGEETSSSLQLFGVQLLTIRRETGGLADLQPAVRAGGKQ